MIFKLILSILSIQLINTSIIENLSQITINDLNKNLSQIISSDPNELTYNYVLIKSKNLKKKMIDTDFLTFKSSTYFKKGNGKVQQLQCMDTSNEKLCSKYKGSLAKCINKNYQKNYSPLFDCKLSEQTVSNKNVKFHFNLIRCNGTTNRNPYEYNLPSRCVMRYRFEKTANFNINDDVRARSAGGNSNLTLIIISIFILLFIIGGFIIYQKNRIIV